MGEPAELSMQTRDEVRAWARRVIDAVTNDNDSELRELTAAVPIDSAQQMVQLERAQVIADSISKRALIEKLDRELFETHEHPDRDQFEIAYCNGWNAGRQGLKHDIEHGEDKTL